MGKTMQGFFHSPATHHHSCVSENVYPTQVESETNTREYVGHLFSCFLITVDCAQQYLPLAVEAMLIKVIPYFLQN